MNKNSAYIYGNRGLNRNRRQTLRIRKDESQGGGAPPAQGANNGGEIPAGTEQGNQQNNNNGQAFDAAAFWNDPEEKPAQQGNQSPLGGSNQEQGNQDGGIAQAIQERISNFKAPEVMTNDVMTAIGNGDLKGFNENINKAIQSSMEQHMTSTVQLMKAFGEKIMEQVQTRIQSSHTSSDSMKALREAIPSATNPSVAPIIEGIYQRALTLAAGNPTKAINMTKEMLKSMSGETSKDLGLRVAPVGSESDFGGMNGPGGGDKLNWLELLNSPQ